MKIPRMYDIFEFIWINPESFIFSAAPTSTIICIDFMSEISESCIDLCFILHTGLNFVIGQEMGGKNVRTA